MSDVEPITAYAGRRGGHIVSMQGSGFLGLAVQENTDEVYVLTTEGIFRFYHEQDCCESVTIQDVNVSGDFDKALGEPILVAEERVVEQAFDWGHQTATFYAIRTPSLDIDMQWHGESNGYYSEDVSVSLKPWTTEMLRDLASTPKGQRALVAFDAWQVRGGRVGLKENRGRRKRT